MLIFFLLYICIYGNKLIIIFSCKVLLNNGHSSEEQTQSLIEHNTMLESNCLISLWIIARKTFLPKKILYQGYVERWIIPYVLLNYSTLLLVINKICSVKLVLSRNKEFVTASWESHLNSQRKSQRAQGEISVKSDYTSWCRCLYAMTVDIISTAK